MKRLFPFLCAVALLAASCGSPRAQIQSDALIADVLQSAVGVDATAPTPSASVPPGCRLVTEYDEYGFEVELLDCTSPQDPPPKNTNWLGSDSAEEAAGLLVQALIDPACASGANYAKLKTLVAGSPPAYRDLLLGAVAALERGVAHCNNDKDAWAESMREAIVSLEEFLQAVEDNRAAAKAKRVGR